MDKKSCLYEIHSRLDSMSAKERRIAEFIIASPQEAVHPSIEELSERIGVSDSTLFRFVRKLGFEGYQQFRIALATESVDARMTVYEAQGEPGTCGSSLDTVIRTNIAALERTLAALDRAAVCAAADMMVAADRLYILGLGGSGIVAQDAYHKLVRTGLHCVAPVDFHLQLMVASEARAGDVGFVISHTGANKDAVALADELKRAGASVIALTDYPRAAIAKLADLVLVSGAIGSRYASEAFSARIVQLAIVDALYVDIMTRLGETGLEPLERMRATIARRRT